MIRTQMAVRGESRISPPDESPKHLWWLIGALVMLTVLRLQALRLSIVDLFPDEAQYWVWAQAPAFGYFSKPPLLAWIIGGAGHVCGESEACLRAPAPLFYFGTAIIVHFIALHLYGRRAAFWSGLSFAFVTGVVFSARIISTDVPLLFFWALALLAYVRLRDTSRWSWGVLLGLAVGFGLLAKYAMIYFLLGIGLAILLDPSSRALPRRPAFWFALLLACIVVAPNIAWNAAHDFVTFRHTQGNIEGGGLRFSLPNVVRFLASQFAVFGPILFATFLLALLRPWRSRMEPADRVMVAFALPSLVLVSLTAFFTRANANWAAPSIVSVTILAVALLVRQKRSRWLRASLAIGLALQLILPVSDAFADGVSLPLLAKPDLYRRTMGWRALAEAVARTAQASGARSIVATERDVVASLLYYLRNDSRPIVAWPKAGALPSHFDLDRGLAETTPEPLLFVSDCNMPERLAVNFSTVEALPPIEVASGLHSVRRLFSFKLSGARSTIAPLTPCAPR